MSHSISSLIPFSISSKCSTFMPTTDIYSIGDHKALVNFSVVLVTGGSGSWRWPRGTSVELLSTAGTRLCSLPNLPTTRYSHSQTGLIICGGSGGGGSVPLSCVTFAAGRWKKTHTLGQRRSYHSAWASPRGVLLMGGGYSDGDGTTTELLTDNGGSTPSFSLAKHKYL